MTAIRSYALILFLPALVLVSDFPVQADEDAKPGEARADTSIAQPNKLRTLRFLAVAKNATILKPESNDSIAGANTRPFSKLFKYDTTWSNPDHRCYEFRQPLTKKQTFLFNFMSSRKYDIDVIKATK